jgi:hypothetical protein
MIFCQLDLILKLSIFSDFCRFFEIFALFRLILHQFWANELPKILFFIKLTTDTALSILPCPRAVVEVFLEKKKFKNFEKFKGESAIFAVRKGTCFAWGGGP